MLIINVIGKYHGHKVCSILCNKLYDIDEKFSTVVVKKYVVAPEPNNIWNAQFKI